MYNKYYFQSVTQNLLESEGPDSVHDLHQSTSTDDTDSISNAPSADRQDEIEHKSIDYSDCAPPSPKQSRYDHSPECHDLAIYAGNAIGLSNADKYDLLVNPF